MCFCIMNNADEWKISLTMTLVFRCLIDGRSTFKAPTTHPETLQFMEDMFRFPGDTRNLVRFHPSTQNQLPSHSRTVASPYNHFTPLSLLDLHYMPLESLCSNQAPDPLRLVPSTNQAICKECGMKSNGEGQPWGEQTLV